MIKTEMDSMPSEMDDLAHRITQLQIEQVSLKKETDALSQSRLKDLEKELAELQDKFRSMKAKWENEKNAIGKVQSLREQIEQTNADIEKAQREYDLNIFKAFCCCRGLQTRPPIRLIKCSLFLSSKQLYPTETRFNT